MLNGLYSATSGMFNQMHRLDTIANNIANADTSGYKARKSTFGQMLSQVAFHDSALEPKGPQVASFQGGGSYINQTYTTFSQGPLKQTYSNYDVAIQGNGFFVADTPSGRMYTRNGNFHVNEQGEVVTADGYRIQGTGGAVKVPSGYLDISEEGVINQGKPGEQKLLLVDFEKQDALRRVGQSMYANPSDSEMPETPAKDYRIAQGFLERANIEIVREMVDLIDTYRQYEANQKVIQANDDTLDKAVNEVGRMG